MIENCGEIIFRFPQLKSGTPGMGSPPATEGGWENRLPLNYRGDYRNLYRVFLDFLVIFHSEFNEK